jgi:cytochrome c
MPLLHEKAFHRLICIKAVSALRMQHDHDGAMMPACSAGPRMKSLVVALALTAWSVAPPAIAAGDPQAGKALAEVWCTSCHTVADKGTGRDSAPPFSAIARVQRADQGWIRAWLADPHPPMPNIGLSRQQIDDIVAYLDALRGH